MTRQTGIKLSKMPSYRTAFGGQGGTHLLDAAGNLISDEELKKLAASFEARTIFFEHIAEGSSPQSTPESEHEIPGYSLSGWFQGKHYSIEDIQWDESPVELIMKAVLGLEDGDELQSFLVKTKEGSSDIRSLPE